MAINKSRIVSTVAVLSFYSILALFSTTAFINEVSSGMMLDQIATLR
jgi:hypothetical protein